MCLRSRSTVIYTSQDSALFGADGIAIDVHGNIYVAVNVNEQLVRVSAASDIDILSVDDNLRFPSAVDFGTTRGNQRTLYIPNYDVLSALSAQEGALEPSIAALDVGRPGRPRGLLDKLRRKSLITSILDRSNGATGSTI